MNNNLLVKTNCFIGNNITKNLPEILKKYDLNKPIFLIDEGFEKSFIWKRYEQYFKSKIKFKKFIIPTGLEPTYDSLRINLKKIYKYKPKTIVCFGGGSCMDTSKAISVLINNKKDPIFYRGFDKVLRPGIPVVCIPTTAGTGSEFSYNASFVDNNENKKMGINGKNMFAYLSILDGVNTLSCPRLPAIGAAVDAFVHSLEGYTCKKSNDLIDVLAEKSIELFSNSVLDLCEKKPNLDKRLNLLKAAHLGGIIQMNSGSGIASAISYPLSVYYKVPHGIGGGMFVLDVVRFNIQNGYLKYKNLSKVLNLKKHDSISFLNHMKNIFDKLGVPKKLSFYKINLEEKNKIFNIMLTQQTSFDQNPIKLSIKGNKFKTFLNKYF